MIIPSGGGAGDGVIMLKDLKSPNDADKDITDNATQDSLIEQAYF